MTKITIKDKTGNSFFLRLDHVSCFYKVGEEDLYIRLNGGGSLYIRDERNEAYAALLTAWNAL